MNQSGGAQGGASAFSGLSDVAITSPSTGQVPVYNSGTGKWENGAVSATDSTKVPLAGTASLSGPMGWSGNSGNGTSSACWWGKDANGHLFNVGSVGGGGGLQVFAGNSLNMMLNETYGLVFYVNQSVSAGGYHFLRTANGLESNVPSTKSHIFNVNAVRAGGFPLIPSDMPYSQAGTTLPNDGNWYNFYSLAQGTHNGRFLISSALFTGWAIFSINGTSISLITDEWGFADVTAASGKIAFRVSGGYLQINVGTGISSTPRKFSATFIGTVN